MSFPEKGLIQWSQQVGTPFQSLSNAGPSGQVAHAGDVFHFHFFWTTSFALVAGVVPIGAL